MAGRRTRTATSDPNHYVEAVNTSYAIYDKSGTRLAAFTEEQLWSGAPASLCTSAPQGDPVVVYDWLADRFVLTPLRVRIGQRAVLPVHRRIEDQRSGRRRLVAVCGAHGSGRRRNATGRRHQRLRQVRALARLPVHGGKRIHAEQRLRRRDVRIVQPRRSLQWSAADVLARLSAAVEQCFHADTEQQPGQGRECGAAGDAELFRLRIGRRRGIRGSQVRRGCKLRRWRHARARRRSSVRRSTRSSRVRSCRNRTRRANWT